MDRGAWWATGYGVARVGYDRVTKHTQHCSTVQAVSQNQQT